MYAIVEIAGQQFKVELEQEVIVDCLEGEVGSKVEFDKVMLVDEDGNILVGHPYIENAIISGTILLHLKGDKVVVFKKKRRKGYQKASGHRQFLTKIEIESIMGKMAPKKEIAVEEVPETMEAVAEPEVEETKAKKTRKSRKKVKEIEEVEQAEAENTEEVAEEITNTENKEE